jgi:hypothetical protein
MIYAVVLNNDTKIYNNFAVAINNNDLKKRLEKKLTEICIRHLGKEKLPYDEVNRKSPDDQTILEYTLENFNVSLTFFSDLIIKQNQANLDNFEYKENKKISALVISLNIGNNKYLCIQTNNKSEDILQQNNFLGIPLLGNTDIFAEAQNIITLKNYFDAVIKINTDEQKNIIPSQVFFYKPQDFILCKIQKFKTIKTYEHLLSNINAKQLTNSFFHTNSISNLQKLNPMRLTKLGMLLDYPQENLIELKKYVSIIYPHNQLNSFNYYSDEKIFFPNDLKELKDFIDDITSPKHPYQIPKLMNQGIV